MTLILGAMDREVRVVADRMQIDERLELLGSPVIRGSIAGSTVVLSRTGVGKSLSAMITQHLIDRFGPSRIIFTGVAGALTDDLQIGDTLVGRDCLQHDMDASSRGFARGRIPFTDYEILRCDAELVACASAISPLAGSARTGRVLTGDQFIADPDLRARLREEFGGDCVEMEGASVGLVAVANDVPFLLIRTISDNSDGSTREFEKTVAYAAMNSWHYLHHLMQELNR